MAAPTTAVSAQSLKCEDATSIPILLSVFSADVRDARDHGARTIFLVDDNITLNVYRFQALCQAIIEARLNKLDYFVQAMTSAIADHGETLAPLMRRAGIPLRFPGDRKHPGRRPAILARGRQEHGTQKRQPSRECHVESYRLLASQQNVRSGRAYRWEPSRQP